MWPYSEMYFRSNVVNSKLKGFNWGGLQYYIYPRSQEAISNEVVRVKAISQTYHVKAISQDALFLPSGRCITGRPPISCSSESSPFQPEITMGYRGNHAMDRHGHPWTARSDKEDKAQVK